MKFPVPKFWVNMLEIMFEYYVLDLRHADCKFKSIIQSQSQSSLKSSNAASALRSISAAVATHSEKENSYLAKVSITS